MNTQAYKATALEMPTILRQVLNIDAKITLVSKNSLNSYVTTDNQYKTVINPKESNQDFLGNPLTIDLSEENDFAIETTKKSVEIWAKSEKQYVPLDTSIAMGLLNEVESDNKLLFAICDAADDNNTLFIGSDTSNDAFDRYLVTYIGKSEKLWSFKKMFERHFDNSVLDVVPKIHVKSLYSLHGYSKHVDDFTDNDGNSVMVEASWDNQTFDISNANLDRLHLLLQVNCGSKVSIFDDFWITLITIDSYLQVLKDNASDVSKFVITEDSLSDQELMDKIVDLISSYSVKDCIQNASINWNEFLSHDMRNEDILEKLWELLTKCSNVSILIDCFNILFYEVNLKKSKLCIPSKTMTTIGEMLSNDTWLPKLDPKVAMQYLIELGMYKLHNDYLFLIENLHKQSVHTYKDQWSAISTDITKSQCVSSRITMAKKRSMFLHGGNVEDLPLLSKYLDQLVKMHLTVECLFLASRCNFSSAQLSKVCENICLDPNLNQSMKDIEICPLVNVKCKLQTDEQSYFQKLQMVYHNVKLESSEFQSSGTATIFHISLFPLVPRELYGHLHKDIERSCTTETKYYIVEGCVMKDKM